MVAEPAGTCTLSATTLRPYTGEAYVPTMRFFRSSLLVTLIAGALSVGAFVGCEPSSSTPTPDGGVVNECPTKTGAPIEHNATIQSDETWSADSVHIVTFNISVAKGATLTLPPCTVVQVKDGHSISIDDGALVAVGTASRPITIGAFDKSSPWGVLMVFAPGTAKLAYATLSDGGVSGTSYFANLEARGDQSLAAQEILDVQHVTIERSGGYGVSLRGGGAFTKTSTDLTIRGAAKAAMRVLPRLVSNIPVGAYDGNGEEGIVIAPEAYGDVNVEDVTLHDRGVRYRVGDSFTSARFAVGPNAYTLTIEPGVKLAFGASGWLETKDNGAISAKGTDAKHIVFTSANPNPMAGDWTGLVFGTMAAAKNALEYVEVRYAGGPSGANSFHCQTDGSLSKNEDSLVAIYAKPSAFIKYSLFADSAGGGINLAYSDAYVDVKATNTFERIVGCEVSRPRAKDGSCTPQNCP